MASVVYLNGEFVDEDRARVSVYDAGLLHGTGLFETMRAYGGVVFRLTDHLAQFLHQQQEYAMRLFCPRKRLWTNAWK